MTDDVTHRTDTDPDPGVDVDTAWADDAAEVDAAEVDAALAGARTSHAALRYTTLRLAIFVLALGLLWLVRVRGVLLVALALLISGLASYVLLRPQREAMSAQIADAAKRRRRRGVEHAAREDAIADELGEAEGEGQ